MTHITKSVLAWGLLLAFAAVTLMPAAILAHPQASSKININTASVSELQQLPRVGPKVAQRIVDYREKHGKFERIEELMKVQGIGEKTFEQLKNQITVGEDVPSP
jgi:competence protein ComEA